MTEKLKTIAYSVALIALLMAALPVRAAVYVGGVPTVADDSRNMLLCTVPESLFGAPLTVNVGTDTPGTTVTIEGTRVPPTGAYTFPDITQGHTYTVALTTAGTTTTYHLAFTFLPIVTLRGYFNKNYHACTLTVLEPGSTQAEVLPAKAKYRGGITNDVNSHKHNFHVRLVDANGDKYDHPILGMRDDNNWIMDAGQIDMARIRNHVGMELWRDFATKPYHFVNTPKAVNGVHSEYVETFINGEYHGLYSLGEAIDRKQLQLKKFDSNTGNIRGLLWKSTSWDPPVQMFEVNDDYDNMSDVWGGMELKYPDLEDVSPTNWKPLYDAAQFVCSSSDEDFKEHIAEYFDVPVLIDFHIFCQVLKAIDNRGKNMYWFVYDITRNKRISVNPWDLDATVGQFYTDWNIPGKSESENPNVVLPMAHKLFDRLVQLNPDNYNETLSERYFALRSTTFALDSLVARYIDPINMLQRAGTAQRETERWSGDTDIARLHLDFEAQKTLIADWFAKRLAHTDMLLFITDIACDVDGNGRVDIDDMNIIVNILRSMPQPGYENCHPDVNHDCRVDIDDLNSVVNTMLHRATN